MLRRQSSYGGVAMSESGTMRSSAFTAYENEAILEKPFHVRLWFYTVTRSYRWIVKNRTSVISAVEQTSALFWLFMLFYQCAFEPIVTFNALYGFNYAVDAIVLILRLGVIYSQMRAKEEKGRRRGARLRTQDRSAWGRWKRIGRKVAVRTYMLLVVIPFDAFFWADPELTPMIPWLRLSRLINAFAGLAAFMANLERSQIIAFATSRALRIGRSSSFHTGSAAPTSGTSFVPSAEFYKVAPWVPPDVSASTIGENATALTLNRWCAVISIDLDAARRRPSQPFVLSSEAADQRTAFSRASMEPYWIRESQRARWPLQDALMGSSSFIQEVTAFALEQARNAPIVPVCSLRVDQVGLLEGAAMPSHADWRSTLLCSPGDEIEPIDAIEQIGQAAASRKSGDWRSIAVVVGV